ncbi:MAG: hypothetical protein JWQ44_2249, partial [Chthoniobacter sp.]|nr:hypothetical protein [Chthoniobacter sp.]
FGNKVDEGNVKFSWGESQVVPYFRGRGIEETGQTFFTPNRQLSSPVMFGSIPSGSVENKPWQTLLFRPDREQKPHPGGASNGPPDHLYLDLFHLPVVEPYAISEPFSTAGKVNLNYIIAPFGYAKGTAGSNPGMVAERSYLRRDTALRGVLKSTFMMAVPTGTPSMGHDENPLTGQTSGSRFRYPIALSRTIEGIERRLRTGPSNNGTLFRSASEICEFDLYPNGLPVPDWNTFWLQNAATGDNMRERPYAHIYPRLTTKSNVYTVHMRCQAIRKAPGSPANSFDEDKDRVLSEYRGSATIERFIDPNDVKLADYDDRKERVEPYYRYRIIATKQFSPH